METRKEWNDGFKVFENCWSKTPTIKVSFWFYNVWKNTFYDHTEDRGQGRGKGITGDSSKFLSLFGKHQSIYLEWRIINQRNVILTVTTNIIRKGKGKS